MRADPSAKVLHSSRLPRGRQQVAAVCYRMGKRGIEFLLVQTRSGRWIFPKGGVEPGLTHAQSAALEAFEEAGVHGRMETVAFARYFRTKRKPANVTQGREALARVKEPSSVIAHLCEVARLEPPQESNRNPTWFSAEKAQQRLLKERPSQFGAELARVVVRAVSRIQRLQSSARHTPDRMQKDGLHKVRFEAHEDGHLHDDLRKAVLARYILRQRDVHSSAISETAVQARFRGVPSSPQPRKPGGQFCGSRPAHIQPLKQPAISPRLTADGRQIRQIAGKVLAVRRRSA